MDPQQTMPHTQCPKCNNFILTQNFLIHEARCKGNNRQSSTFANSRISTVRRESNGRQSNNIVQQERIPCPFCGYGQTLKELDTHPNVCPHREVQCTSCRLKFPISLMEQHALVCSTRARARQQQRSANTQQRQINRNNSLPQRNNQGRGNQYNQRPQPQPTRQRNQNVIRQQESDSEDQRISQELRRMMEERRRRQAQDPFDLARMLMGGFPGIRPVRNPSQREGTRIVVVDPGQLIALLARRARQGGQTGLSKEQIKRFPITKYVNHQSRQKAEDEDMCAICYCNFQQGQNCMNLTCKHKFHPDCIGKWLQKNPTCPLCKKNFKGNGSNRQEPRERQRIDPNRNIIFFNRVNLP